MSSEAGNFPQEIDWIYFDLDETLWNHLDARDHAVTTICEELNLDPEEFTRHYKEQTLYVIEEIAAGRMDVATSRIVRLQNILNAVGCERTHDEVCALAERYLGFYLKFQGNYEGVTEVLAAAGRVGHLAIVTNAAHETQDPKIAQLGGHHLFEVIVTTDETDNIIKPDDRFFDLADKMAGNPNPSRVLMVGDTWENDIAPAHARGYWCVWVSPEKEPPEELDRVVTVKQIRELLPMLEALPVKENLESGRQAR